jgi:pimeloyl-ACP methyl ester carboxylesterase
MKRFLRNLAIFLAILIVMVVALPLIVPIPPPLNTRPASELADADSRYIQVNGLQVHTKQFGTGEPVLILLHGFGASTFSWREVSASLADLGRVVAYDRPAFGLTERPLPGTWQGESPYGPEANRKLLFGVMDSLGIQNAILVGHSAGGRLAVQAALANPERVLGLVLVDAAVYGGGERRFGLLAPFIDTPQMNRLGPFFARSLAGEQGTQFLNTAWHDPDKINDEVNRGYRLPLQAENWDVALWEFTKAGSGSTDLAPRLKDLTMPVLVISGDDDRIVPTDLSTQLAGDIPGAQLAILENCGHVPHEECPANFLAAVEPFIRQLPNQAK